MPPILIAVLYILIAYYFWWLFLLLLPIGFLVFIVWLAGRIFVPLISGYIARKKERRKLKKFLEERLKHIPKG
jgi:lauroyl/myristoyl acyltransferase